MTCNDIKGEKEKKQVTRYQIVCQNCAALFIKAPITRKRNRNLDTRLHSSDILIVTTSKKVVRIFINEAGGRVLESTSAQCQRNLF